jgi:hypothetical protein
MPLSPLLPIAGVAAASLAREAASAVESGLSFAAELMRQGRGEAAVPATGNWEINQAREQFTAVLWQFARRLKQHLAAAGLVVSGPIELAADGLGAIEVGGNHPQAPTIEALLAADDSLREQFASLAERYELLSDGGRRHEFALLIDGDEAEVIASKP